MNGIESVISNLVKKSNDNVQRNDSDYEMDGLLYCGKCHTAKQMRVEMLGKVFFPYHNCKCQAEKAEQEENKRIEYETKLRIDKNRAKCFHNKELMEIRFDKADFNDNKPLLSAQKYALNFADMLSDGTGLIFYGGVGVGKTFAATCIANAVIGNGYTCYMTDFSRILHTVLDFKQDKQLYLDSLNSYDLLIIDDLGAERDTDYANEIVVSVIDSRVKSKKPIIVTTNLTAAEFFETDDVRKLRIYSRMFEMCIPIQCLGKDKRMKQMLERKEKYRDLLGLE